jgi:F-type H+-transporting ATPase subunit 8
MPQLVPFFFINEITFTFFIVIVAIYLFSSYILPGFVSLNVARKYISELF